MLALAREGYTWRDVDRRELAALVRFPGFRRLAAHHWRMGLGEVHRSLSKKAFVRSAQRLVPEVQVADFQASPAGVRAQALGRDGTLFDDFVLVERPHAVHVVNAPSPAATASLAIGRHIAGLVTSRLD